VNEEIRFIDLFSGIGGFRLGLERANQKGREHLPKEQGGNSLRSIGDSSYIRKRSGQQVGSENYKNFRCVWSNDFNKYANQIYTARFGTENHYSGDIREIDSKDIPPHDLLCGGFPCQSFSVAGKRKGFTDTRGTLFFEILRIAKHHQPSLLLLENVKGLLSAPLIDKAGDTIPGTHGRVFETILKSLEELGYWWEYQILNSKNYGVPQNRERVFIIGHSRNGCSRPIFPVTETDGVANQNGRGRSPVQVEIGSAIHSRYGAGWRAHGQEQLISTAIDTFNQGTKEEEAYSLKTNPSPTSSAIIAVLTPDRQEKRQHGRRFKEAGEPMFTITSQDKHGVLIHRGRQYQEGLRFYEAIAPTINKIQGGGQLPEVITENMRIRRLTPVECELLQAFPKNWTAYGIDENGEKVKISDTQRYKVLGNAVTTSVITFLGHKIREAEK